MYIYLYIYILHVYNYNMYMCVYYILRLICIYYIHTQMNIYIIQKHAHARQAIFCSLKFSVENVNNLLSSFACLRDFVSRFTINTLTLFACTIRTIHYNGIYDYIWLCCE